LLPNLGDRVLAYFGYPQAHEDDAERAVRTGLGVIDAIRRLEVKSIALQARVGIATGLVVVGDQIGEGAAQEQAVVELVENQPELLAQHYAEAGLVEKSVDCWAGPVGGPSRARR
jgi:hypothetical protein